VAKPRAEDPMRLLTPAEQVTFLRECYPGFGDVLAEEILRKLHPDLSDTEIESLLKQPRSGVAIR
jgi:hypothetical protein